jgi:hypothetical protein
MSETMSERVKTRFLEELKHHLEGWRSKIKRDFGEASFKEELRLLNSDPLYPKFNFATADYVNIRFIGRMSISIGRRLGEIYDKVPRFLVGARFGLEPAAVAPVIEGLELDICLRFSSLTKKEDLVHVMAVLSALYPQVDFGKYGGIGIEIRYNFNPNDSSRLRKDVVMAQNLEEARLFPIYLVFSSISPRDEAIKRLTAAGWSFIVGQAASVFSANLFGLDLGSILDLPEVKDAIKMEVDAMMTDLKRSYSFNEFIKDDYEVKKPAAS